MRLSELTEITQQTAWSTQGHRTTFLCCCFCSSSTTSLSAGALQSPGLSEARKGQAWRALGTEFRREGQCYLIRLPCVTRDAWYFCTHSSWNTCRSLLAK